MKDQLRGLQRQLLHYPMTEQEAGHPDLEAVVELVYTPFEQLESFEQALQAPTIQEKNIRWRQSAAALARATCYCSIQ